MDPAEVTAERQRVQRLRQSAPMQAVLAATREIPEIHASINNMVRRRADFQAASANPGERHRALTSVFAGMITTERAAVLLDSAIDRTALAQTEFYRQRILAGHRYAPVRVVGGGPNATIFNQEFQVVSGGLPTFTTDRSDRLGGQFAGPGSSVWLLNSRTRPEQPDKPHRPGTSQSLNTLGSHAVVQQADVEPFTYGDQDTFIKAGRLDQLLVSEHAVRTELAGIRVNSDPRQPGAISTINRYTDTGELVDMTHDAIVAADGVGDILTGFEKPDGTVPKRTQRILDRQSRLPLDEKRVLTSEEFAAYTGDKSNPMPLKGWKKVAVMGPGDTGRVAVLKVLGYETSNRQSVPNIDYVEELGWYYQVAGTKEELSMKERLRYVLAALDMPRADDPEYYHRINPYDNRARRLEEAKDASGEKTGNIVIVSGEGEGKAESEEEYDHVVICAGYKDRSAEVLGMLQPDELTDPSQIAFRLGDAMSVGTRLTVGPPGAPPSVVEVTGRQDDGRVQFRQIINGEAESALPATADPDDFRAYLNTQSKRGNISRLELPGKSLETEFVYADGRVQKGPEVIIDNGEKNRRLDEILKPGVQVDAAIGIYTVVGYDADTKRVTYLRTDPYALEPQPSQNTSSLEFFRDNIVSNGSVQLALRREDIDLLTTEPIALRYKGVPVYRIGPSAALPVTDREREVIPVLGKILPNSAALFRYGERDEAMAPFIYSRLPADIDLEGSLLGERASYKTEFFDAPEPDVLDPEPISVQIDPAVLAAGLPYDANWDDYIAYAAAVFSQTRVFPPEVTDLSLTVEISDTGVITATPDNPALLADTEYRIALAQLVEDPLMAGVIAKLTDREQTRLGRAKINLPMQTGRVDLASAGGVPIRR